MMSMTDEQSEDLHFKSTTQLPGGVMPHKVGSELPANSRQYLKGQKDGPPIIRLKAGRAYQFHESRDSAEMGRTYSKSPSVAAAAAIGGHGRGARPSSSSRSSSSVTPEFRWKSNAMLQEGESDGDVENSSEDVTSSHDGISSDDGSDYDEDYREYYIEDEYYDDAEDEELGAYQEEEAEVRELERQAALAGSRQEPWHSLPAISAWTRRFMTEVEPKTNPYTRPPYGIRSSRDGQAYERPLDGPMYYIPNPYRSLLGRIFDDPPHFYRPIFMWILFVVHWPWTQRGAIAQTFRSLIKPSISTLPVAFVVFTCAYFVLGRQSTLTSQLTGTSAPYKVSNLENVWELLQSRQRLSQFPVEIRTTVTPGLGARNPRRKEGGSLHRIQIPKDDLHSIKDIESRIEWIQRTLQDLGDTEDQQAQQVESRLYLLDRRMSGAEQQLHDVNEEVESLRQYSINSEWIEERVATLVELQQQQRASKATVVDEYALPTDSKSLTDIEHQVIQGLIDEALEKYAADVLAKPDYALHSAGGRIIPQMTFFNRRRIKLTYLGRLLGLDHLIPAQRNIDVEEHAVKAIQPDMHMGACWAMNGTQGQIAIRLSRKIVVTEVTVEHVDPRVAFDIRSAPKEMEVWRLVAPEDEVEEGEGGDDEMSEPISVLGTWWREGSPAKGATLLTKISYRLPVYGDTHQQQKSEEQEKEGEAKGEMEGDGSSPRSRSRQPKLVQTFQIPRSKQNVPSYGVVVKVNSNWGHPDFTCLYRVRVHGYEPTP